MRTGPKTMIALLAVPLLVGAGFAIFFATRTLVANDDTRNAAATPRRSVPVTEDSPVDTNASTPGLPPPRCGQVSATDVYGNPLGAVEPLVHGIHDAACRRDYAGLLSYMEDTFNEWFSKEEVVAEWEREDSDGFVLQTLVETLETQAVGDQGGHYFCHPNGAIVVFARGTNDRPGMWTYFDLTGRQTPAVCEVAG